MKERLTGKRHGNQGKNALTGSIFTMDLLIFHSGAGTWT